MTQMKKRMGVTQKDFCSQGPQSFKVYFSNNYTVNSLVTGGSGKEHSFEVCIRLPGQQTEWLKIKEIYSPHSSEGYKSEIKDGLTGLGRGESLSLPSLDSEMCRQSFVCLKFVAYCSILCLTSVLTVCVFLCLNSSFLDTGHMGLGAILLELGYLANDPFPK